MYYYKWTKEEIEQPHFPFIRKMGLKVEIQNSENPLEFFKIFTVPEAEKPIDKVDIS